MPESDEGLKGLLCREINLIDNKENARARGRHLLYFLDEVGIAVDGVLRLGDIQENVRVHEGRTGELKHLTLKLVVRREDTRSVGIDHLEILAVDDTHDTMAGGLRLRCDDRKAFTHQGVHEGRFADVGIANDIYEPTAMGS